MNNYKNIGFIPADILIPSNVDMNKWSVVACDQYTSQPEYWQRVREYVGDAPSTLKLILPEAELDSADPAHSPLRWSICTVLKRTEMFAKV